MYDHQHQWQDTDTTPQCCVSVSQMTQVTQTVSTQNCQMMVVNLFTQFCTVNKVLQSTGTVPNTHKILGPPGAYRFDTATKFGLVTFMVDYAPQLKWIQDLQRGKDEAPQAARSSADACLEKKFSISDLKVATSGAF